MSDRVAGLTVVLEKDLPQEDAQRLIEAIKMLRGVLSVTAVPVDFSLYAAQMRARNELGIKIVSVIYPKMEEK